LARKAEKSVRIPRFELIYDGCSFHLTWKTHNSDFLLVSESVKQILYLLLLKHKTAYGIRIFAYCFMSNHIHIVGQLADKIRFSRFLQLVHSRFAKGYNKDHGRSGQVIQDRAKTPVIEDDVYLKQAMIYTELNPWKAKMVKDPKNYRFSSYRHYAFGEIDPLIDTAPVYLQLADTPSKRQEFYRKMVAEVQEKMAKEDPTLAILERFEKTSCYFGDPLVVIEKIRELRKRLKRRYDQLPRDGTFPEPWNKHLPPLDRA
jgi:putative transposase